MFALTFRNFCFSKKLLRKSLDLTRTVSGTGEHGGGNFSKTLPKLVYLHNPLTYLWAQFQLARIRLFWDREFEKKEFYRGTSQAASVMTDCIREQNQLGIGNFTTPVGYQQITRDMILSKYDPRLKLLQFRFEDIHRAVPTKVVLFQRRSNRHCFIDMSFVGMRNTNDFENLEERQLIRKTLDQLKNEHRIQQKKENAEHRILFAEIYMRFFRDYTPTVPRIDWSVSFYKIVYFDVLNL